MVQAFYSHVFSFCNFEALHEDMLTMYVIFPEQRSYIPDVSLQGHG